MSNPDALPGLPREVPALFIGDRDLGAEPMPLPHLDAICDLSLGFAGLCETEACWSDGPLYPLGFHTAGRCRRCGCTERRACRDGGRGCYWANATATLCSRCADRPGRRRFRRRRLLIPFSAGTIGWYWEWRRRVRGLLEARDRQRWGIADGAPVVICGDPAEMSPETLVSLRSLVETINAAVARGDLPTHPE